MGLSFEIMSLVKELEACIFKVRCFSKVFPVKPVGGPWLCCVAFKLSIKIK